MKTQFYVEKVIDMIRILINAGHHPQLDWGAINRTYNVHEADIAKSIAMKAIEFLNAAGGYECEFIQENSLNAICNYANRGNFDLFISIHTDSVGDPQPNGTTTFVCWRGGESEKLAQHIQYQITNRMKTYDRGVREASYTVLVETIMPAVLIECAFISNEHDVQLLMNPDSQTEFARSIALGVTDYYKYHE